MKSPIEVRHNGHPHGPAIPHRITRHAHPKARPETPDTAPPASGIDYLKIVTDTHHHQLATDERISIGSLYPAGTELPGQTSITEHLEPITTQAPGVTR